MGYFLRALSILTSLGLLCLCMILSVISGFSLQLGPGLPQIESVKDLKLQTPLRIYSADNKLMGEFGEIRRQPLPYDKLPPLFVKAVLAAEDDRFFSHGGVDAGGLLRAASELAKTGRIQSGGSTITMQLARNFFLSTEKSFIRKFNEILLSIQLERSLSKEEIFELYANKIFLGNRAYGVQSAAFVYYGKSLDELTLSQWAMLAGLPKAPSKYNPLVNPGRALARRDWIIHRMLKLGFIDAATHDAAIKEPEIASLHGLQTDMNSPFVAEMGRQFAIDTLGENAYTGGYNVYTTVDSRLQIVAQQAIWDGIRVYDLRHGYRGPEKHFQSPPDNTTNIYWLDILKNLSRIGDLEPAIIIRVDKNAINAILRDGKAITIEWSGDIANFLRPHKNENHIGSQPTSFASVFKPGDLIRVRHEQADKWLIGQIPRAQAALVSLNSTTGAVIALVGGSDFALSKFNRATQAMRQPGSSFKPFFYIKALEEGYTPATLINDSPIVFQEAGMQEAWRPENAGDEYLGPTRLRRALYESRNMVSIRILQSLGVPETLKSLSRFGFDTRNMQPNLSLALGTHAVPPMTMAEAYTVLANGGFKVKPFLVQRIEDSQGNVVYQQEAQIACHDCEAVVQGHAVSAPRVVDEQTAYIIDDILKDVIRKGTGRAALELGRADIAGKTGTTNGPTDVWFSGYNPSIVTTTWLGFDDNTFLGKREYGGTAALPIWIAFMREALKDMPVIERPMPTGLTTVRIDPDTGHIASPDRKDAIFEIFRSDNQQEPSDGSGTAEPENGITPSPEPSTTLTEEIF